MNFEEGKIYHIYNRGNNKQRIFLCDGNYWFFLKKLKKEISGYATIMAYCLMPNHFHLMVQVKNPTPEPSTGRTTSSRPTSNFPLNRKIGTLLSSYTRAINIQENRTGSLFQQKTKAKCLNCEESDFLQVLTCLNYIHQNPLRAGLVNKLEDWQFSSFNEFISHNKLQYCDKEFIFQTFNMDPGNFYKESYDVIDLMYLKKIW